MLVAGSSDQWAYLGGLGLGVNWHNLVVSPTGGTIQFRQAMSSFLHPPLPGLLPVKFTQVNFSGRKQFVDSSYFSMGVVQ